MEPRKLDTTITKEAATDIKVTGDPDQWQLICKASSDKQGWMKSTKAMQVSGGCIVQTTNQQKNPDGSWALCDALVFVPNAKIVERDGKKHLS